MSPYMVPTCTLLVLSAINPMGRTAATAKSRLRAVIASDRERVPAWRWVRYRGYLIAWGVTFARKPRYRWERRR